MAKLNSLILSLVLIMNVLIIFTSCSNLKQINIGNLEIDNMNKDINSTVESNTDDMNDINDMNNTKDTNNSNDMNDTKDTNETNATNDTNDMNSNNKIINEIENKFDYDESFYIYLLDQLPYGFEDQVRNMTCGYTCDKLIELNQTIELLEFYQVISVQSDKVAYVVLKNEQKKEIYFSFKGTNANLQLIHEFIHSTYEPYETVFFKLENAKAMQYFQQVYLLSFQDDIVKNLRKYAYLQDEYKFVFSGFSLGAALASLASLDAITSDIIKTRADSPVLYTHGSPRVANAVLSDYINSIVPVMFRVVNYNDLVPHVPPCSHYLIYCVKEQGTYSNFFVGWHLKKEIWINTKGINEKDDYKECDLNNPEDTHCSDKQIILNPNAHESYYGIDHNIMLNWDYVKDELELENKVNDIKDKFTGAK